MDELFGISMDLIMYVLVALLMVSLGSVAFVALRNRIMFKMGIRNIPRRRAQTVLIVLGLMLSTVIISAAFTTGDTVNRSITSVVYGLLGSVDEVIQLRDEDEGAFGGGGEAPGSARDETFPAASVVPLVQTLRANPEIDYVIPSYSGIAVAVNMQERLSAPLFTVMGLDPAGAAGLPDLESTGGKRLDLSSLAPGEIFINESAADELDVQPGGTMVVTFGSSQPLRVKDVLKDTRLAGAGGIDIGREGGVLSLAAAQTMFNAPGALTQIAISNSGDARGGLAHADSVETDVEAALKSYNAANPTAPQLQLSSVKRTGVDIAETGANLLTTFFLVLGLFSIGAGVLLIFMIFVMLAAERKSEMGMARAVGTKRADIVQTFLSEGMAYNILAALVGTAIGVLVAIGISEVMAALFADVDLDISPYVTPRSLIISYSLGVVLTFLTVTFSSWRVSNINIVSAIRDIPETAPLRANWGKGGFFPTLRDLIFKPGDRASWLRRAAMFVAVVLAVVGVSGVTPLLLVAALIVLGVLIAWVAAQPAMPMLMRISTVAGLVLVLPVTLIVAFFMTFQLGPLFIIASLLPLFAVGISMDQAFALMFALSLLPLGLALVVRSFGANERVTYTIAGLFLIYIWEFDFSVGLIDRIFGKTDGDIEMFFLSGVMVTLAATFLVVYNADLILKPITLLGRYLGSLLPSLKMAVAYPLSNKMRTGMTMAMFCLVVFALTVMSSMNHNFNRLFLSDAALGGWDVTVDENPTNPIGDLRSALTAAGSPAVSQIAAVGTTSQAIGSDARLCQVTSDQPCTVPAAGVTDDDFSPYRIWGDDAGFFQAENISLQSRARGYDSDQAAWRAVAADPSLAIIDAFAVPSGGGFGSAPVLTEFDADGSTFDPLTVRIYDRGTHNTRDVRVIGVIQMGASNTYSGLHISQPAFQAVFGAADFRRFFVKTVPGADNKQVARDIESALLTTGAQADGLRDQLDEQSQTQSSFFYLMQGFMGLGLFVGVAAVGVIAFRTVVERRQQIGMLRAMGYTKGMVGLTFMLESAFIAFMGVLSGIVFAVILARQLITTEFASQGATSFSVPWQQLGLIGGLAFGAALLMTLIPSRQAASIPIAQALRYE